ncbi:5'-AMP-activated protein kinase subunit beta-1-like isoform X2 [Biomphalaria glabrata]|uniref:5'-AMP-activated protein kinase subunit beta-1 n=1 Tax=Biomphalaria glabrata TaxID=6526 RepID=A0A9W2ZUP2_BIOGL|nr:5'-AMP-activated protein kinase subunit beta-1-like isoform X2 [Biomphalaria glabrata]
MARGGSFINRLVEEVRLDLLRYYIFTTKTDVERDGHGMDSPTIVKTNPDLTDRQRAATLTPGQEISHSTSSKLLPTVFKWEGGGKDVYLAGSFNNWKTKIPLAKSHGDFYTILDLPEGEHQYKFFVDGQWVNSPNEKLSNARAPVTNSDIGTQNNTMRVKRSDFDAFEALAIDGRAASKKDKNGNDYGQDIPPRSTAEGKHSGPPFLPPQLLQVILNKDTPAHVEPSLLPEPNHVMLNHLYALSIKDGVMVLSATHRFRKKYVTTLLYKPIQ